MHVKGTKILLESRGVARGECLGGGGRTLSGEATNHLEGSGGMLPGENFLFLELGNAISCLLTRVFSNSPS